MQSYSPFALPVQVTGGSIVMGRWSSVSNQNVTLMSKMLSRGSFWGSVTNVPGILKKATKQSTGRKLLLKQYFWGLV